MYFPTLEDYIKNDESLIASVAEIFSEIATLSTKIFANFDNELLQEMAHEFYFANYRKPLKILYYNYCKNIDWTDAEEVSNFFKHIGKVGYNKFSRNWETIYDAYFLTTYKPLENYDMEQVRTPLLDTTNTTTRKQDTKVETGGTTSIVPFNSTEETKTGASTGDSETTEEKTKNEIESSLTERGTDTLTRHGNIGVTTSQQMLESELNLRKLDFQKRIFRDVESIIFRDYWPAC